MLILLIEIVLSVDNASVLAVIVNRNLSNEAERKKALTYGIIGAYVFRGLSLFLVSWLIYNPTVGAVTKILGGIYLCYLYYTHSTPEADSVEEGEMGYIEKFCLKLKLTPFWSTVIMVEFLDIVFSLDNLVACVSLSSNFYVVCTAVFLGIIAMRFVAQYFSNLLLQFPTLENSAFIVILLLGIKMSLAGIFDFFPNTFLHKLLNNHNTDLFFSLITLSVFIFPIIKTKLNHEH